MVNFYVRTTGERLLDESYNQLDYVLLVDYNHDAIGSFIDQLSSHSDACVILEDDLILCENFKDRITDVIAKFPNDIINFFEDPHIYYTTHYKTEFAWNQCTYYPSKVASKIGAEMRLLSTRYPDLAYDLLERKAMNNLSIRYLVYRPCLVQHKDFKSLIQPTRLRRITPYFIDYLNKYDIEYENAFTSDNLAKLKYEVNLLYSKLSTG